MKRILLFAVVGLFFTGCNTKQELITKTVYQDVYIPVKCLDTMPVKPVYDSKNLESAKDLMRYYEEVEILLKGCVDE